MDADSLALLDPLYLIWLISPASLMANPVKGELMASPVKGEAKQIEVSSEQQATTD
jgi:hypothetical protein